MAKCRVPGIKTEATVSLKGREIISKYWKWILLILLLLLLLILPKLASSDTDKKSPDDITKTINKQIIIDKPAAMVFPKGNPNPPETPKIVQPVTYTQTVIKVPQSASSQATDEDAITYGRKRNAEIFGEDNWAALQTLWGNESGWSDTKLNYGGSGAAGICQNIRGFGPDYVYGDHVSQIEWGLAYIKNRYGTPNNALAFWYAQSPNHWY